MGKILICGTGRAGSSFLVRLLTHLGFDTGFSVSDDGFDADKMSGCEITIARREKGTRGSPCDWVGRFSELPRVMKSPEFSFCIHHVQVECEIDHVILPIRDVHEVANSRVKRKMMFGAQTFEDQVVTNCATIGATLDAVLMYDIPYTILKYPNFIRDWKYCWYGLKSAFGTIDVHKFTEVHERLAKVGANVG